MVPTEREGQHCDVGLANLAPTWLDGKVDTTKDLGSRSAGVGEVNVVEDETARRSGDGENGSLSELDRDGLGVEELKDARRGAKSLHDGAEEAGEADEGGSNAVRERAVSVSPAMRREETH